LKEEQTYLQLECNEIEGSIKEIMAQIKAHQDSEEHIDVKILGLELTEEMQRKKFEDQ
jgi:hypothetical protein